MHRIISLILNLHAKDFEIELFFIATRSIDEKKNLFIPNRTVESYDKRYLPASCP